MRSLFFLIFFLLNKSLWAGSCLETPDVYLKELSSYPKVRPVLGDETPLECLRMPLQFFELDRADFADVRKLSEFMLTRKELRVRAETVLAPILADTDTRLACAAAESLALFRSPRAFERLVQCPASPLTALALGISGDERAVEVLVKRYQSLNKKYAKRTEQGDQERLSYLNALFHLGSKKAIPFLDEIARTRQGSVHKRILQVRTHLNQ